MAGLAGAIPGQFQRHRTALLHRRARYGRTRVSTEQRPVTRAIAGDTSRAIQIDALVQLASQVLRQREQFHASFAGGEKIAHLGDILRVGTSAGGARAKAIVAWNPQTREVRSGQVDAGDGFEYWLLKFDGVSGNRDREREDSTAYCAIEFAYHRMAIEAGIKMSECRLLEENNRRHFMTRRFDRSADGKKIHMQSLGALAHFDFNTAGAHSYEQAFLLMRQLAMPMVEIEQQFRRMAFNIIARNQDDHVKNIAFLMDKSGHWSLSPAFDVTYSYNPDGAWTGQHQMSMNGVRDGFAMVDFIACAKSISMKRGRAQAIVDEVHEAVSDWKNFADNAGVIPSWSVQIQKNLRLELTDK